MRLVRECCWLRLRGWGRSCEAVLSSAWSKDKLYSSKFVASRQLYKKANLASTGRVLVEE